MRGNSHYALRIASVVTALVALLTIGPTRASADAVSFVLSMCNPNLCANGVPGPYGTVSLQTAGAGTSTVINVTVTMNNPFGLFGSGTSGAFAFNFNGNAAGVGVSIDPSTPAFSFSGGTAQMDGFGSFQFVINGPTASGATTPLIFTVTCPGGCTSVTQLTSVLSTGGNGSTPFAAHVRNNSNGITGFAGATPLSPVPEPASLISFGTVLAALGGARRRWRKQL